jgi:hypothetical protein
VGEGLAFYKSSILSAVYQRESRVKRAIKVKFLTKFNKGYRKAEFLLY